MANQALGKTPIENETKNVWLNPLEATNGIVDTYDSKNGFSHAVWPATYTLRFDMPIRINVIRFLLWDNLGSELAIKQPLLYRAWREYRFSVELSNDGQNYDTYYDTGDKFGADGWQIFEFKNPPEAKFVRLNAKHNNINRDFHIVEFEVFDNPIISNTIRHEQIGIWEKELEPIKDADLTNKLQKALDDAIESKKEFDGAAKQFTVIQRTISFNEEAIKCRDHARQWLGASIGTIILMITSVLLFYCCDNNITTVELNTIDSLQNHSIMQGDTALKTNVLKWSDSNENRNLLHCTIYLEFVRYYLVPLAFRR